MKSAGCARWRALKLGNSVPIKPGDVCSLLPDKCWFKIISVPDTMQEGDQTLKRKVHWPLLTSKGNFARQIFLSRSFIFQVDEEDLNNDMDGKKACLLSSMETAVPSGEGLNGIFYDKDPNEQKDCPGNGNGEPENAPVLQIDPARFFPN